MSETKTNEPNSFEFTGEHREGEEFTGEEIRLIQWEEWALSMEEHFHATEMFERNPNGLPMGHR